MCDTWQTHTVIFIKNLKKNNITANKNNLKKIPVQVFAPIFHELNYKEKVLQGKVFKHGDLPEQRAM